MASSEDVPAAPSSSVALESVTEKTEDQKEDQWSSDKLSDEGLGTSEADRAEDDKLNEVSDSSNEDLATAGRHG